MAKMIGVPSDVPGRTVRGIRHFYECYVSMWPDESTDDDCTCNDDSPEWTDD
jgi:hypothetical protein